MDKALFKRMCRGLGLPIIDWREIRAERWAADAPGVRAELTAFAAGAADPRLMVKPSRLGSSVGMTLVHDIGELTPALDLAFRYDTVALVESYLAGARDLEVSIIGNDPARLELYGPGEIVSGHEFYDYAAKYTPGLSETSTQAEVPARAARGDAQAGSRRLPRDRGRGLRADGLPGRPATRSTSRRSTRSRASRPISLFPTLPAEGGYTFAAVCVRIVELAIERHAARVGNRLTPGDLPR